MCSAASLNIHSLNIDHSNLIAGHNTALVKVESVFGLGFLLAFEVFLDGVALEDDPVCLVLDLHLYLLGDGGVVSDIEVGVVFSLLGSVLPDVGAEHSPCSCVDDVGARVEGSQSVSAFYVDLALDWLADHCLVDLLIQVMKEAFADFLHIIHLVMHIGEEKTAQVMDLSSRGGIKSTSIQDNNVLPLFLLFYILKHSDDLALELRQAMILVVQIISFSVVYGIV